AVTAGLLVLVLILSGAMGATVTTPLAGALLLSLLTLSTAGVLCSCPFLLAPAHYWTWIGSLETYEPATYWGQAVHRLVGLALLALPACAGGLVGAMPNTGQRPDRALGAAVSIFAVVLMLGITYGWWTRVALELAILQRRAVRNNRLPPPVAANNSN